MLNFIWLGEYLWLDRQTRAAVIIESHAAGATRHADEHRAPRSFVKNIRLDPCPHSPSFGTFEHRICRRFCLSPLALCHGRSSFPTVRTWVRTWIGVRMLTDTHK
jgi:hypothetical protein